MSLICPNCEEVFDNPKFNVPSTSTGYYYPPNISPNAELQNIEGRGQYETEDNEWNETPGYYCPECDEHIASNTNELHQMILNYTNNHQNQPNNNERQERTQIPQMMRNPSDNEVLARRAINPHINEISRDEKIMLDTIDQYECTECNHKEFKDDSDIIDKKRNIRQNTRNTSQNNTRQGFYSEFAETLSNGYNIYCNKCKKITKHNLLELYGNKKI